jgi:hypothetical protein
MQGARQGVFDAHCRLRIGRPDSSEFRERSCTLTLEEVAVRGKTFRQRR